MTAVIMTFVIWCEHLGGSLHGEQCELRIGDDFVRIYEYEGDWDAPMSFDEFMATDASPPAAD
jgi:hypothetical protein